jgi:hypothetical protein
MPDQLKLAADHVNTVPKIGFPAGSVTVVSGVNVLLTDEVFVTGEPVPPTVLPNVTVMVLLPFQATVVPANVKVFPFEVPTYTAPSERLPRWSVQSVELNAIVVAPLAFVSVTVVEPAFGVMEPLEVFPRVEAEQMEVIFRSPEYVYTIVSPVCGVPDVPPAFMLMLTDVMNVWILKVLLVAAVYGCPPPAPVVSVPVSV